MLLEAMRTESPDDGLRRSALIGFGELADPRSVPVLLEWAAPGKPLTTRAAAIRSLGSLDTRNGEITRRLLSYLDERISPIRRASLSALEERDDASVIPSLEAVLNRGDLSEPVEASVRSVVAHLRKSGGSSGASGAAPGRND
jgi:HEAT repeat protein